MSDSPFNPRVVVILIVAGTLSLVLALLANVFFESEDTPSAGKDTFSRSALGHRAFVELLKRSGVPVRVTRHELTSNTDNGVLVVAEPTLSAADLLAKTARAIVVLPKWRPGRPSPFDPLRLDYITLESTIAAEQTLLDAGIDGDVVRVDGIRGFQSWTRAQPETGHVQLVRSPLLTPWVEAPEGILIGEYKQDAREVLVVADPDLLSSQGLGRGHNAAVVLAAMDRFRRGGEVVVDETLHGFELHPNIFRELFRFPLVIFVVHLVLTAALAVYAGISRLGPPQRAQQGLGRGSESLVESTAALLELNAEHGLAVKAHWHRALELVAQAHHRRAGTPDERMRALEHLAVRYHQPSPAMLDEGVKALLAQDRVDHRAAVAMAQDITGWKEGMIHGSGRRSEAR